MKRIALIVLIILIIAGAIGAWLVFGPATTFSAKEKYVFVRDNPSAETQVMNQFDSGDFIRTPALLSFALNRLNAWNNVKPGRFAITKGESIFDIVRTFRNNHQSAVHLVIKKLRTKEDFAGIIGRNFSTDSSTAILYFNNNDSLDHFGVDSNTLMTLLIPDTYFLNWNTSLRNILTRLQDESDKFWNADNRLQKADAAGFSRKQVYTIASIVEEETNSKSEKGNIASVYMNRLNKGMMLQADPTIKFALKNFALNRIYYNYLNIASPYNTYRNKGLPPGPICTPQQNTIDAVLNAPKTDYIYFVANSELNGTHRFSSNYAEHQQYAKQYQQALNEWMARNKK